MIVLLINMMWSRGSWMSVRDENNEELNSFCTSFPIGRAQLLILLQPPITLQECHSAKIKFV